jgi:hypothetical protein
MSSGGALAKKSVSQVFLELKNNMEQENAFSADSVIAVFPQEIFSDPQEAQDTAWNRFFEELSLSKDYAETVLPSKILRNNKIYKKASFPNSSSLENNFSPRRFLIDRCEANGIYSKMIFTSVLISQLKGDKYRKQNAREELWKAQDSCLFTPGKGLKRNELRKAAYNSLLRAERLSRERGKFISSLIQHDFDLDGVKEYLFQDARINCYIQLKGAGIFELDYLPKDWNYLDCGSINYNGSGADRRAAFADAIVPSGTQAQDIERGFPLGSRLCFNEQFESASQPRNGKSSFVLGAYGNQYGNIEIGKSYSLKKDVLTVSYSVKNTEKEKENFSLITEIDFSFAGNGEDFVRFYTTDKEGRDIAAENAIKDTESLKIHDIQNEVQLLLGSAKPFSGCLLKACDDGLYQADRILAQFDISLESGENWTNEFSLKFSH